MILAHATFWIAAGLVVYTYLGYALLLWLLPGWRRADVSAGETVPTVTMVIAAYNEERFIHDKVKNALAVRYPEGRYNVVVVSDGSADATNDIVREFDDERLTFIALDERGGKANALNNALRVVDTDLVVFTDANVFLDPDAIEALAAVFADPATGAVTGRVELESIEENEPLGEGAYMRYERLLQSLESDYWSVAGVDGALFAARRSLVDELPPDTVLDDFTLGVNVALAGFRVRYEPRASAVEQVPAEVAQEFRRKTRIAAGSFQMLSRLPRPAFRAAPARFRFAFLSHKLLRWYVPFLLVVILLSNLVLLPQPVYALTLAGQLGIYGAALLAHLVPGLRQSGVFYVPYYFTAMNLALMVGWFRHRRNQQSVTWSRVDR
ncbi:MAG: glycosyltransferase family 2 protein [Woeseiaceae bacterium]|nr:glycosyltransferase family 2 protein [Woeseiaceae bacterium]